MLSWIFKLFTCISENYEVMGKGISCSEGTEIKDVESCIAACIELELAVEDLTDFKDENQCYTNRQAKECCPDGKSGGDIKRPRFICRKVGNQGRYSIETRKILLFW